MLFTLSNSNKLKFAKGEKYACKRNSMKRSYFLSRKFFFNKIKVCTFTFLGTYIYAFVLNIVYIIYCTRVCVKSYQTRTSFNAENVIWGKGVVQREFSRFSFSISRVFSPISRYVYELSLSSIVP